MLDKILIANRGEIACRILRTCRRLGIRTVAVHSEADAGAPHVRAADEAVLLGPAPVRESYLDIERVIAAARQTGARAVHPGYGLLSENASFGRALAAAGITFIGPPPEVLDAFGDKIKARSVARAAGTSPTPGTDGPIDPADAAALAAEGERIGYPLLVKAAGGGGGIGMQLVQKADGLARAAQTCSDRGKSAFADARVYLERYIESPKHIEVQIFGDGRGGYVALGERECSLQRRHQKIVEETPSAAPFFAGPAGTARRRALWEAALRVVASVGYVGAGTVEFVASPAGELYFLEVNARLQVEHCVTEMVTGLDLVEQQIRVASGEGLGPAVWARAGARLGVDGSSGDEQNGAPAGHAIEVRVYAEDPAKRFAPQPGRIARLVWPEPAPWLRIETGVEQGSEVTPYYDPLLAKLVAHGPTREDARARLDAALGATELELVGAVGPAATNLAFLRKLLASERFVDGSYDTLVAEALAKAK
ncbi:MAG: ATP-grasp domain-containing protein [Polyangiaceae bacterium]|nr:ATP-grasp domain-containing protein [Polyangiaceae bacterium]